MITPKYRTVSNIAILVIGIALLLATVSANLKANDESTRFRDFRAVVFNRCQQRIIYDASANSGRDAQIAFFRQTIDLERQNPYISDEFRARRIAILVALIDKLIAVNRATVTASCEQYKP